MKSDIASAIITAAVAVSSAAAVPCHAEGLAFDAGADLRIREELMENVPGLPNGGFVRAVRSEFKNHVRFRPRVWAEIRGETADAGNWRIFTRLADEFRWNIQPYSNGNTFPGELMLDNLFLEGKGLFDDLLDLKIGRQDLYNYCGLAHVFVDGTPGDGSRSIYTDMAALKFHVDEVSTLDAFALYNTDDVGDLRWGTDRSRHLATAARFPGSRCNQDDWGAGLIWGSKAVEWLPYQVFAAEKRFNGEDGHTELLGAKVSPEWAEGIKSDFEAMSELNGEWSGFASVDWKGRKSGSICPLASLSYHYMSEEWDPMWSRGVNDSELFLYGTHNGVAWWSNMHFVKLTAGMEFGPRHRLTASTGPMFAARNDYLGDGNGTFKGLLTQGKYEFPLWLADRKAGERFEIFGHFLVEFFNPGDYYATSKPAWFVRWQIEMRF